MHGDFSRWTHDPTRRYTGVLKQQGRVELDADANEQVAISQHLRRTVTADVVGPTGAPLEGGGFQVGLRGQNGGDPPELTISAGRMYVDGILCQLEDEFPITEVLEDPRQIRLGRLPHNDPRFDVRRMVVVLIEGQLPFPTRINAVDYQLQVITLSEGVTQPPQDREARLRVVTTYAAQPDYPLGEVSQQTPPSAVKFPIAEVLADPKQIRFDTLPGDDLRFAPQQHLKVEVEGQDTERYTIHAVDFNNRVLTLDRNVVLPGNGGDAYVLADERTDLVYLDVWERHITAIEDPGLRDVALGGPDTTTRQQTICQVKIAQGFGGSPASCRQPVPDGITRPSDGRLTNSVELPPTADEPCEIAPGGGFRGLENRLYRVEIHASGWLDQRKVPTFKWSRDNGAVVFRVTSFETTETETETDSVRLAQLGRDQELALSDGDWVELIDDHTELRGQPGTLVQVKEIVESQRRVIFKEEIDVSTFDVSRHAKLRRWDGAGDDGFGIPVSDTDVELEDGIHVRFSGSRVNTGDFWFFAARTATRDVDPLTDAPPHGIQHHFAKLALIRWHHDGAKWTVEPNDVHDCRPEFPWLTQLTSLAYVGGDGQEGMAEEVLCAPLEVRLTNGAIPVPGVEVTFKILPDEETGGLLIPRNPDDTTTDGKVLHAITNEDGLAECDWSLAAEPDCQSVEAFVTGREKLLIHFNARVRSEVQEPVIQVELVVLHDQQHTKLLNDSVIMFDELKHGILVRTSGKVDTRSANRATCFVSVEDPVIIAQQFDIDNDPAPDGRPPSPDDSYPVAYVPVVLAAEVTLSGDREVIRWHPTDGAKDLLDRWSTDNNVSEPLLARLTLSGNFIWGTLTDRNTRGYLDGDTFGVPGPRGATHLLLPSGDGRPGGDFRMWFWLQGPAIVFEPPELVDFGTVFPGFIVERDVLVRNDGNTTFSAQVDVSGTAFQSELSGQTITVEPGKQGRIPLVFTPPEAKPYRGRLEVGSAGPPREVYTIQLVGAGEWPFHVDRPELDFGNVQLGQEAVQTINVSNDGDQPLIVNDITSDVEGVTVEPTNFTLAGGESVDVQVTMRTRALGRKTGRLRIQTEAGALDVPTSALVRQ